MEFDLDVVDYLQAAVTDRKCMSILPNNDKRRVTQKVVVGDKSGVLQCFGVKKRDVNNIFKLLPGAPISRVQLGGALGTPQDKIFVASGADIRGYSRKGKKFLDFNSNLTETVANLWISGSDLVVGGQYVFNHFSDCVDQGYYLASDKINDIMCLPKPDEGNLTSVLACNDRVLRVLEGCELKYEAEVSGSPQTAVAYKGNGGEEGRDLVYGTSDGKLGHVLLTGEQPIYNWEINNESNLGGINCLSHYDITGDGVMELLVGRDDGKVEIYSYDAVDQPTIRFSHSFNESVTSVQGGVVGSLGYDEVVVSTYSGWVTGLTTEHLQKKVSGNFQEGAASVTNNPDSNFDAETTKKLLALRAEIDSLQQQVENERNKHMQRTSKAVASNSDIMTYAPAFHVNDKFVLSPNDSSYTLSIEVQTAIDHIVLQSDVPIDLLDVESTSAVVSYTTNPPSTDGSSNTDNFLLATYRCQANTTRLEVKVRSIEGQFGHLQAYIVPRLQPKTSIMRKYPIKPLSLHQRVHDVDENRAMNELKLLGPFSFAEVHSWLVFCLPDLPDRTPAGDNATLYFTNTFLETQLVCSYSKGEARICSDNISTISILKDIMSKEATSKKISLNIQFDINEDSIRDTIRLLHPKLDQQLMLAKKVQLLDALQELQTHEGNINFLAPEYQQILEEAEDLKIQFKKQPARLERLYGMITDLYIDKFKFKGINVKQKVPQLLATLDNYDQETLIEFFQQPVY
uniref:Bardet-Biedl syndrome 7 protein homolog n=1 Tax=Ciona intestinalis TaxID=7719 RepID=UPI000180C7B8|nr:Bardet-Biedl syndrome 7 protein homolog [Ciona intestinalis]|eukprot:XP_002127808.1 Bardet-Biedl syndrome 7 protein homolog [Ciona intestinalis]